MASAQSTHEIFGLVRLGFAAVLCQTLLIREAMSVVGGSELSWGIVLATWLLGMALGAALGGFFRFDLRANWLPAALIFLTCCGLVLLRAAPSLVDSAPGEITGIFRAWWLWIAAVLPAGLFGGLAFPLLAEGLGPSKAGLAYAAESAGALAGGVAATVASAYWGTVPTIVVGLGLVASMTIWRRNRIFAACILVFSLFSAVPGNEALSQLAWKWSGRPDHLERWKESLQQRLELSSGFPASLYADGRLVATVPDPFRTEPRAHLLMLLHPNPAKVLAIGSLADGSYSYLLSHSPASRLLLAESDPAFTELLPLWYSDRGVVAENGLAPDVTRSDPVRAVKTEDAWDLVLLLDQDPVSIRSNRTRTVRFFETCREHMSSDGILVLRTGVSDTYTGGLKGRLLGVLYATLRAVFPHVTAIPGEDVLLVASQTATALDFDVETLNRRWSDRGVSSETFAPEMLELLIDPQRKASLHQELPGLAGPVNTAQQPRAVLVAAGISEGRAEHDLFSLIRSFEQAPALPMALIFSAAVLLLLLLAHTHRFRSSATALVVGASSMGQWLILLLVWQSTRGSVFTHVGALSACFMAGLWFGSSAARNQKTPAKLLPYLLAGGAVLSLASASGLPFILPQVLVPVMLLATGGVTGAAFSGIASLASGKDTRRGSGKAFAAEELGAALAALLIAMIALPTVGLTITAAALAVLQLAGIPVTLTKSSSSDTKP